MRSEKSLDIIIPSRNEMFLKRTIEDIIKNMRGDTRIYAILDGAPANPPLEEHPALTILNYETSIGQRAATNVAAARSDAKYIMKCDAHCAFDEGFDVKMMDAMQDNWTMVPIMRNLHAFDWVCKKCGDRRYQGPTPTSCPKCDNTKDFERDILWIGKSNPQSTSYCFDPEPHFQYFREYRSRPEYKGDLTETMSLQGSCFMLTRDKYFELNICDEKFGSWGSQGIEVAVKTWLSGGRVVVNHRTWYAHMFRTQGGDFGFPYSISGRQVANAKATARNLFFNNKWEKQVYPLSWLLEKFWPVPGWTEAHLRNLKKGEPVIFTKVRNISAAPQVSTTARANEKFTKGIVYYTDNRIDEKLMRQVQAELLKTGLPIVSVSLKPLDFGTTNIVLDMERSYLTMFTQILMGIENMKTDIIFLAEHDVLYSQEHFLFTPPSETLYYYNKNQWQVRQSDGHAVYWDCKKVSQICAFRDLLLKHYVERVRRVQAEGFTRRMGFEPGSHNRSERVDNVKSEYFETTIPNLDIRHARNLTSSRWSPSQFRNPCRNWQESHLSKLTGWEGLSL